MMNRIQVIISMIALGLLLIIVVNFGQAETTRQPADTVSYAGELNPRDVNDIVHRTMPIQGRLTDANGAPLHGNYNLTFRLYHDETEGTALCTESALVSVDRGLFSAVIDTCYPEVVDGQTVWLGIEVESDGEMTPRQRLLPVAYALSLRPGAKISADLSGQSVLTVENIDTMNVVSYALTGKTSALGGQALFGWAEASTGTAFGVYGRSDSVSGYGVGGLATASSGNAAGVYGVSDSNQGRGVEGYATTSDGITSGVYGSSLSIDGRGVQGVAFATNGFAYGVYGASDSTDGRGVAGWATASSGDAYGVYGRSDTADGAGVYARGVENGADLILHGDSASQDNGTIYSDPDYPSSDIVLRANDGIRIDLDNDGDGEDADLEIFDKDDALIFGVDESGALKTAAESNIWISGNGLRKKNSDDLTKLSLDTFGGVEVYPGVDGLIDRDVMLPVILPGQLYGQNVTVTGIDVYFVTTGSSYIDGIYIRRQNGAGSGDLIIADLTNRTCLSACSYHLDLSSNNVLNDQNGVIYIAFALHYTDEFEFVQIGGVRLTLEHD